MLICCDDDVEKEGNNVHYFMQTNHTLLRCVWTTPVCETRKCFILKELREWYEFVTEEDLMSGMVDREDEYAWEASHGPMDL